MTTTPKAWDRNFNLTTNNCNVIPALGLHPQVIADRLSDIPLFFEKLSKVRFVGEVGIDGGPRFYKSLKLQMEFLEETIRKCENLGNKVLSIHSVRKTKDILDIIEKHRKNNHCEYVFHWFSGSVSELKRAIDLGCFFSINVEMAKSKNAHQIIPQIPLNRVLTETDGPFILVDDKTISPCDVKTAIDLISGFKKVDSENLKRQIVENCKSFL